VAPSVASSLFGSFFFLFFRSSAFSFCVVFFFVFVSLSHPSLRRFNNDDYEKKTKKKKTKKKKTKKKKTKGEGRVSIDFKISLSLSLSRRRDDINNNTSLLSLFLHRVVVVVVAIHRAAQDKTEPPFFFPRQEGKFFPRLLFSTKCRAGKERERYKKQNALSIERTFF